jgi:hypothetical protein
MTPDDVTRLFTRSDGSYAFARWNRPLAPVVFGVEDRTLGAVKGAYEAVARLAGLDLAQTDPELGANLMTFFFRDWDELRHVPDLDRLIPDLADTVARLESAGAARYRMFRFDPDGAIRAAFLFVRMDAASARLAARDLALAEAVQAALLWSDRAFADRSPLAALPDGSCILRPEIAQVIRAAYDPVMPVAATDPGHALRLAARLAPPA